jgi:flagellin
MLYLRRIKMGLSVATNLASLFVAQQLNNNADQITLISQEISSNKMHLSGADAAIASQLGAQQSSYGAVLKNLSAGTALLNTATTALTAQQTVLAQMSDLATQASSNLLNASQRAALGAQFTALQAQLDTNAKAGGMFGSNLVGTGATSITLQTGINSGDTTVLSAAASDSTTLAVDSATVDLTTAAKAQAAMTAITAAVATVSTNQSTMATQLTGLKGQAETTAATRSNITAELSTLQDANIPELSSELTKLQTQAQITTQMLGITNSISQNVINLIK